MFKVEASHSESDQTVELWRTYKRVRLIFKL